MSLWYHVKTGGAYQVICEGFIEATLQPVVVYRALKDQKVWVRPTDDFLDGRFVQTA
jgi:hypothetical protein